MKPIAFAVLLTALLCGPHLKASQAQSDLARTLGPVESKRAFNLVPPSDSAYDCISELKNSGIAIAYPGGTNTRIDKMTGYEFGIVIARLLTMLMPPPSDLRNDLQSDYQATHQDLLTALSRQPQAITALLTLLNEFQPEILALGQDVSGAKQRLFAITPFTDIPYNDNAYKMLGIVQDAELVQGYSPELNFAGMATHEPTGAYSTSGYLTPFRFAVAVTEAYPLPLTNAKFAHSSADTVAKRRRADAILAANPAEREALQLLTDEFRPVLDKLGQDVPTLNARLAALAAAPQHLSILAAKPFPDVPPNHWAAQAVEAMRTAGIVAGYPVGTFRTDSSP